jgi:hypothetical protein
LAKVAAKRLIGMESNGTSNEYLSEVGKDAPITLLVGIGQRAA